MVGIAKILIVEDNKNIQDIYALMLEEQGYEITQAFNIKHAFDVLKKEKVDLIILDMILPQATPQDTCEIFLKGVKENPAYKKIPVLAVTVVNHDLEKQLKRIDSRIGYIRKPFSRKKLVSEIERLLKP